MTSRRFPRFLDIFTKRRSIRPLERLSGYIQSLAPSDKFVLGALGTCIVLLSLTSVFVTMRALMVEVPAYGGSLTEGAIGTPRFVNPLFALSDADRDMVALTYAGLMGVNGEGSYVPVLAERYEVSPDGKTYTFMLRRNAVFTDGTPVTADDVVFTIEKAQDPGLKSPEYSNWASIRAEAVDTYTVRFTLPKPYAPFLADATLGILPAHLWRNIGNDKLLFSPLMQKPVGAGPFKIVGASEDKEGAIVEYELAANTAYAPGRPYLDRVRVRFYPDQGALQAAYKSNKVESAYGVVGNTTLHAPYSRVFGVFFNQKEYPAFADLSVRKAFSLAINRTTLVNDLQGGHATALMSPIPPEGDTEAEVLPTAHNIEEARSALEAGGWSFDTETVTWTNTKSKLTLDPVIIRTSSVPELKALASQVQADWLALGVSTSLEIYEPGDLTREVIRPRAFEALYFGMVIGRGQDLYAFWHSGEQADPGLNIASYADKTVDALLERARSEQDPTKALAILKDASVRIAADYPAAFTHAPDFLYAIPKTLYGVNLPQIAAPADRFATVATWYRERAYIWPFLVSSH